MTRGGVLFAVALTLALSPAAAAGQAAAQPDLMFVSRGGAVLTGDDIYADGAGQQRSVVVERRVVLIVRVQNDGTVRRDFNIIGSDRGLAGPGTPFQVRYRFHGSDVTDQVARPRGIPRGLRLRAFSPGDERDLRVIVEVDPSAPLGAELELEVSAAGTPHFDGDSVHVTITKTSTPTE